MNIEIDKLTDTSGFDESDIEQLIRDEGTQVFVLSWDGNFPGMSGANCIYKWKISK